MPSHAPQTVFIPETPYHMVWLATDACTARCQHCSSNSAKRSPDELTTDEAKDMIDQLAAAGVIDLGISGGEPLLRRDMLEIISHAKQRNMTVGIASNGAKLSATRASLLAAAGLDRLQVSLDGFAEQHDKLRRWPGLFECVLETIQTAYESGLRVHVCCTVTRLNCDSLEAFVAFLSGTGIKRLNLSRFVPTGRGSDLLDPGDNAWRTIIERSGRLKVAYAGRLEITTHLAQQILVDTEPESMTVFAGCQAGRGQGCITANGTVLPCVLLPISVGNIRRNDFRKMWTSSPTIQAFQNRDRLKGACGTCSLRERCGGCRAVAYARSRDPLAEDPRCWVREQQIGSCLQ
jgi:radical SAM protein with 4Fe4S-binding SPASM domain